MYKCHRPYGLGFLKHVQNVAEGCARDTLVSGACGAPTANRLDGFASPSCGRHGFGMDRGGVRGGVEPREREPLSCATRQRADILAAVVGLCGLPPPPTPPRQGR